MESADQRVSHITDLSIIIVSIDESTRLVIHVNVVEESGDARIVLLSLHDDSVPQLFVSNLELHSQVNHSGQVVTAVLNQDFNGLLRLACLKVEVSLLTMQSLVPAHLRSSEWWITISRLEEYHKVTWRKLNVKFDLLLVVLAGHLLIDGENFVQE